MWFLLLILATVLPGVNAVTVLRSFPTEQECQTVRASVEKDMNDAYPEGGFTIICEKGRNVEDKESSSHKKGS